MQTIALYLLSILFCALIAEKRNRSCIKAILVGICFSWIGVLLLAVFLHERDLETGYLK